MDPQDLIAKFVHDGSSVLRRPEVYSELLQMARSENPAALIKHAISVLLCRLFGNNIVLVQLHDTAEGEECLKVFASALNCGLDGAAASLIKDGTLLKRDQGVVWKALTHDVPSIVWNLPRMDGSYIELSSAIKSLLAHPIKGTSAPVGVLTIDTTDPSNFRDENIEQCILNTTELCSLVLSPSANNASDKSAHQTDTRYFDNVAQVLFQEIGSFTAVQEIAPIMCRLGLGVDQVRNLIKGLKTLETLQHEQHPASTAIVIPEASYIAKLQSRCFLVPRKAFKLSQNGDNLGSLALLTDGCNSALVLAPDGSFVGTCTLPAFPPKEQLLPIRYQRAGHASEAWRALLVLNLGHSKVAWFYMGRCIGTSSKGEWQSHSTSLDETIREMEITESATDVFHNVLRAAMELAHNRLGALFTVGDVDTVQSYAKPAAERRPFSISSLIFDRDNIPQIAHLASLDGALLVDDDGEVKSYMEFLDPPPNLAVVDEPGRGTRHSAAVRISAATQCTSVAVSVDGPISIYRSGALITRKTF